MTLLVANRGEIAVRLVRAARERGLRTVAVYAAEDAATPHVTLADEAHEIPGYLDQDALVEVARRAGADLIHPGYGFLSENAAFARRCAAEGLTFVGPRPELLDLFGDKVRARAAASDAGVPVLPGTLGPTSLAEAAAFLAEHGAMMVKGLSGGGGRGMREVTDPADLAEAYARCRSEADIGEVYVERLLGAARHVEVQIVGDGTRVHHLGERDCSIQRRHQKLIEIAPAPFLDPAVRRRLHEHAVRIGEHVGYESLGTVEFLVEGDDVWFLELNPRLQVEHTVTEEVTGVDLVDTQIRLAQGGPLPAVDPAPRGFAIQARVNTEELDADGTPRPRAGLLTAFDPPAGPHVRVDTYGYAGLRTSPRFDSLLAKVIARGATFPEAARRVDAALAEFRIEGPATTIPFLRAVLTHPDFTGGPADTGFVAAHLAELRSTTLPGRFPATSPAPEVATAPPDGVTAPMDGVLLEYAVEPGARIRRGERLLVIEAMKMEFTVRAETAGTVGTLLAEVGAVVEEGAPLLVLEPAEADEVASAPEIAADEGWAREAEEVHTRRALAREMGGPAKVARQHETGRLTVRERIDALVDKGSFSEIAPLTGFATYSEDNELTALLPVNFVSGTARIDGRRAVVGADDFTIRGSSGDAAIWQKQVFTEEYAGAMRLPVVRLLDGASGGGSVVTAQRNGYHYLPVNPGWDAVVENMSLVPVVSACLGPTVGLGAARLAMSHLALMVEGIGQVFTAGPPVVQGSSGEDLTKEQLGGAAVHRDNGLVERFVRTESEAFGVIRGFLSYLPSSVFEVPPVVPTEDPADRADEGLLHAVPRNPREPYAVDALLEAVFDRGSVFRYAEYGGATVTALARLDGHPVGVVATDPTRGVTISAEGAQAITRLVDLCETFHLPLVSLTDQGGASIGSGAERKATIRFGVRAIAAVYQARIPQAEIIVRRVFGVGGAGIVNRHRANRTWAWPSATWGSLPAKGGVEAAFRAQLAGVADRAAEIARIERELETLASPFRTVERFGVQDLIDPRESRAVLCEWVRDAYRLLPEQLGRPAFGTRP
ncbi:carboxyl transferase domain-containing protein [Pseudonocardia sp. WMMC193]|uniref:carboxyl transferase domain-containing protein n=1 Tax=Pseudonocardia sp. WMMC193 TaxID=2911965 RepID=UPI001F42833A|nr:carboxyl transferase domain-containing protein [Pseudonocardia sp. WMMC193]MCF7551787.1 carbamoyl-phosphate synthase large subunit [Pseudonocardia sp. WMMC193]